MNPRELDVVLNFIQQHPEAAARELELHAQDAAAELIQTLPLSQGRQLITHMLPQYAGRLLMRLSLDTAAGLLSEFNANQAAAILRGVPKIHRDELLGALPDKTSVFCRLLLSYSDDSVGGWMSADIVMLPSACLAEEALQRFVSTDSAIIGNALPVVDGNSHIRGLVFLRDLMRAKGESSISHLYQDAPPTLSSRASLAAAARHQGWQEYDILPVLNRNKQLIGLLRYVDMRRGLEQFGEIARVIPQDDFLGNMSEAYKSTLVALLGLVDKQPNSGSVLGER